jgi:glycosyltransferase involved in cell wall biosynthesis
VPSVESKSAEAIWCVIPVHNNAATIRTVALACRNHIPNVLVVDDGSTDADVASILQGSGIEVVRHPINQGKGSAILTALDLAFARHASHIVTIDGDGQHSPGDLPAFIRAIENNPDAIVIGRRNFNVPHVPGSSRFGRAFSNFWIRLETGLEAGDSQSGFRAYPVQHIAHLHLHGAHYDFEVEVLTRAAWAGIPLRIIDVDVTYFPPRETRSSFRPFRDNLRISLMHARLIGRRLVPWPHRHIIPKPGQPFAFLLHPKTFLTTLLKESATPGGLAASAGLGIFLGALPLIGLHIVFIIYVATRLKLNRIMAVTVSNLCMPPVVPALCIELGYYLRHGNWLTEASMNSLVYQMHHRIWEWLLGSLVMAPLLAVLMALTVLALASAWQKPRGRPHA